MLTILNNIKSCLQTIPGIVTCKVGIENGINPDDYPLIRIVPTRDMHGATIPRKKVEVLVYYGAKIGEIDEGGLEAVYAALCGMEDSIITALESCRDFTATWEDTVTDEDRLEAYKLFASRFMVVA